MRAIFSFGAAVAAVFSVAVAQDEDPYLWLEEVEGEEALRWVREENKQSQTELEAHPSFEALKEDALSILTSEARIPYGQKRGEVVYNFWQDDNHVRGVWRRASVESYKTGSPEWETVIDFDAFAKSEEKNWIRGATVCLSPEYRHCMVEISDGGKDAGEWREFDTVEKKFVEGGFYIPEAKSNISWFDEDMILVGTDYGDGTVTTSGYPRTLRAWSRGETLAESPVIFEGDAEDVSISSSVEHDGDKSHIFIYRARSFFEYEVTHAEGEGDAALLPFPLNANLQGVLDGRAIVFLREDWRYQGETYPQGAIVAYDLDSAAAELVLAASDTQSIEDVEIAETSLLVQYLDNVAGKAARLTRENDGGWTAAPIEMPDNGVVSLASVGGGDDTAMISFESMTQPDSLYFVDEDNAIEKIAESPALYDASDIVVEQRFATSSDGTKVPYFLMGKKDVLAAGDAPVVQYGYGGFLVAQLPVYYSDPGRPQHGALAGKMWVNRGGVLALSNIRGGSEFGPRWHEAALKENRQLSFDDFIAISEHLIDSGVTSADKLGAIGRSNGGLLMGAIMTQRPELYAAINIGVPLFDMKRYNKLLAGASWMGEYGNPDIDDEWAYISQYSPYQKLEADQNYPKVLFYTSTKDDRVHPGHARKAAAKLADLGYDFFYYENIEGGHGGTANQEQLAYRTALEYAYFMHMLMDGDESEGEGE